MGVPSNTVCTVPDDQDVHPDACPEPVGNAHCPAVSPVDQLHPAPGTMPAASTSATMAAMGGVAGDATTTGADATVAGTVGTETVDVVVGTAEGAVAVVVPVWGAVVVVVATPAGATDPVTVGADTVGASADRAVRVAAFDA